jgi:glycosyltransferase involved in cell wall biosynthesis
VHGGFETFAEQLALYLTERGWRVIVYCQEDGTGAMTQSTWRGIQKVIIPVSASGAFGAILFDWKCIRHAARFDDLCLTLGYNTAIFCAWLNLKRVTNLFNMDGVEWRRAKWNRGEKAWLWLNDWAGCWLGRHLIADHPEIARHLETRVASGKITTIAYGAERVRDGDADTVRQFGLEPGRYLTVVARAEPENSILEIVRGFSLRPRGVRLVVLGKYDPSYPFHAAVKAAASDEVLFLGTIYDKPVIQALRFNSLAYVHGHQVGGTNPSLVEALGAGNAVLAHDNRFNRWVAGPGARYFRSADTLSSVLDEVLSNATLLTQMRAASVARFESAFRWAPILKQYEELLTRWLPTAAGVPEPRAPSRDASPRAAGQREAAASEANLGEAGLREASGREVARLNGEADGSAQSFIQTLELTDEGGA